MAEYTQIEIKKLEQLKMLASIAESADNSILLLSQDGSIEWINKGFERLHGYNPVDHKQELENESADFIKIVTQTDRSFFQNNNSFSFSRSILTKQNELKWIQSTLTPIKNDKKQIIRFVVIETDITQQKEVEEDLVQRWENTQTLTEHLESAKDFVEEQVEELSQQKLALEKAKEKSEEVLNKVLPYEVAIQLKKKGFATPRQYKKVTILNLNIRNFYKLTKAIPAEQLVEQLHQALVQFDGILENHYVEKIKTSGGNYIGAGGVPLRNRSNPIDVVLSALEIKHTINSINLHRLANGLPEFMVGMGIHTGRVIAGVVGKNKLTYDIWGDTVNIASAIERNIPENKIFISQITLQDIHEFFDVEKEQNILLESEDEISLFEVIKIKDKFASDLHGIVPNNNFMQILSKL